ncbi:MAG TPA: hypothetical protein VFR47_11230 [Anaerolineales bacterium]|nr:hypothetical protein [Anaerolineales bacterium]
MNKNDGFIVVQRPLASGEARNNPRYRGIDRLIPWSMEHYSKGFDDPYLSPEYATDEGLIRSALLAQKVLLIFTEIVEPADLEILYVRKATPNKESTPPALPEYRFVGFDVAADSSPFYSLVSDFPPTSEISFQTFREQFNENGLFDEMEVARDYLEAYLERYPEDRDKGIIVWEIYRLEQV